MNIYQLSNKICKTVSYWQYFDPKHLIVMILEEESYNLAFMNKINNLPDAKIK
jgi:hypothetical protein